VFSSTFWRNFWPRRGGWRTTPLFIRSAPISQVAFAQVVQLDKDLSAGTMDQMCIEILVEALRAEDYLIQTNAVKLMQVRVSHQTITWNKFFTGNELCPNFKQYKERLEYLSPYQQAEGGLPEQENLSRIETTTSDSKTDTSSQHSLVDGFILCMESLLRKVHRDSQTTSKLTIMINMLINNPKVAVHGNSILSLYRVAFQLSMPRDSPPESPINERPQMQTVENYIAYLIGKCEKSNSPTTKKQQRNRLGSGEAADHKLFQSLVVAPKPSVSHTGSTHTFLYDDSSDMMKSSIEQDPRIAPPADDLCKSMIQKSMVLLVDQVEVYMEKRRKLRQSLPSSVSEEEFEKEVNTSIPIFSVPSIDEKNLLLYSKTYKVNLTNEKTASAGLFGWCYMCRSTADFYCKDTRLPVCGKKCKENLLLFLSRLK
jgi:hypothetical protein